MIFKYLPGAGRAWKGWYFRKGELKDRCAHRREYHTPGRINAWYWLSQQLTMLQARENQATNLSEEHENVFAFPRTLGQRLTRKLYRMLENGH